MGQRQAKKQIEEGIHLYNGHHQEEAVKKWKQALRKITNKQERFATLGYLAAAYSDWGKYRDMLIYSIHQIDLANEADNCYMRAEAYLNLAKSNELLGEYHKAVSYCRHSLQNPPKDPRCHGYVYLCMGNAYFGFSNFSKAIEYYEHGMRVAKQTQDKSLELQVLGALGTFYITLKDTERGLSFHTKAADLAKSFNICDLGSKYQRITTINMATPLRRIGRLNEALEYCEEAMKMALEAGDRPVQAKCLMCLADIHRNRDEAEKAYSRYEASLSIMTEIGDRHGQCLVLSCMAKTLSQLKQSDKAIDVNQKALTLAQQLGNKLFQLRCHMRMEDHYRSLGDMEKSQEHAQIASGILEEMDITCTVCGSTFALTEEALEIMPCTHIFHLRCMPLIQSKCGSKKKYCPKCRRSVINRPTLV